MMPDDSYDLVDFDKDQFEVAYNLALLILNDGSRRASLLAAEILATALRLVQTGEYPPLEA